MLKSLPSILFFVWFVQLSLSYSQNSQTPFGKSRVQFRSFEWKSIKTKHFRFYYYRGGNSLAHNAARYAEMHYEEIVHNVGYVPDARINILIYNSINELQQSNIGMDNPQFVGGETELIKSKIEIGFNGDHTDFQHQITYELANLLVNQMVYGSTFKQMLTASYTLNLPDWYTGGASRYFAYHHSPEMDVVLRDVIYNREVDFTKLSGEESILAGQSFWYFISKTYGENVIANILNLTRLLRNEEDAIATALGIPFDILVDKWVQYWSKNIGSTGYTTKTLKKNRLQRFKLRPYKNQSIAYNNDSSLIAYGENFNGRIRVKVFNFETGRSSVIFNGGYRLIKQQVNESLPLLAWRSKHELSFLYYKKGKPQLVTKNLNTKKSEKKSFLTFDDIHSFDYCDVKKEMVISASQQGRSDLYIYDWKKDRAVQITKDLYTDFNPKYIPNSQKIVWVSNRSNDSIDKDYGSYKTLNDHFNIFEYNHKTKEKQLTQHTSGEINFQNVIPLTSTLFYSLGTLHYAKQVYKIDTDKEVIARVSNFSNSITSLAIGPELGNVFYGSRYKSIDYIHRENALSFATVYEEFDRHAPDIVNDPDVIPNVHERILALRIEDYTFASEKNKVEELLLKQNQFTNEEEIEIKIKNPKSYDLLMGAEYVSGSITVDQLRGFAVQLNAGTSEMFANHKFDASLLFLADLKNSSYGASYSYLKNRNDWKISYDRFSYFEFNTEAANHYIKNNFEIEYSHPFSISNKVSFAPFYTRTTFIDQQIINKESIDRHYGGFKLKYTLDNTITPEKNVKIGSQGIIAYENYQCFDASQYSFSKLLLDLRTFKKIYRTMTLALRGSYGVFMGNSKKMFMLGGMDNWLFANTNYEGEENPLNPLALNDGNADILFHEFATSMRGFGYNEMYGHQFMLINAELRMPITKLLVHGPIRSPFFRDLQLITFFDMGSAWREGSPFDNENDINSTTISSSDGNFSGTVLNYLNPFLQSYGFGARSTVYSYYMKLDIAWGVKNFVRKKPMVHFTLGYDF